MLILPVITTITKADRGPGTDNADKSNSDNEDG